MFFWVSSGPTGKTDPILSSWDPLPVCPRCPWHGLHSVLSVKYHLKYWWVCVGQEVVHAWSFCWPVRFSYPPESAQLLYRMLSFWSLRGWCTGGLHKDGVLTVAMPCTGREGFCCCFWNRANLNCSNFKFGFIFHNSKQTLNLVIGWDIIRLKWWCKVPFMTWKKQTLCIYVFILSFWTSSRSNLFLH